MILRSYLVDQGIVQVPNNVSGGAPLPNSKLVTCFYTSIPDAYELAMRIRDSSGLDGGREMVSGRRHMHPGVLILFRALTYAQGYDLAVNICQTLDQLNMVSTITPEDEQAHYIQAIKRTTDIIDLGEDTGKRRQLLSINARISFQDREGFLG